MIVENGSVTMDLDLNRLNGIGSAAQTTDKLQFAVAANSFFSILVFNDLLRGPDHGSMALVPQNSAPHLPVSLSASIRQSNGKTSFRRGVPSCRAQRQDRVRFFNVEGGHYDYEANGRSLSITGGRLLVSNEFAKAIGRPSDAGSVAGQISLGATMEPIEINHLDENGNVTSASLPPLKQPAVGTFPAPMLSSGICSTLCNPTLALSVAASASLWELMRVTKESRTSIGLPCRTATIRLFRRMFTG